MSLRISSILWGITALFLALFVSGCSPYFWRSTTPVIAQEVKLPEKIVISELDFINRPYKIIGEVNASVTQLTPFGASLKELANQELQKEALKQGADGIIYVQYKTLPKTWKSWGGMEAKGTAVVFKYY